MEDPPPMCVEESETKSCFNPSRMAYLAQELNERYDLKHGHPPPSLGWFSVATVEEAALHVSALYILLV
eukprot:2104484-Amphidinium_carterae.1